MTELNDTVPRYTPVLLRLTAPAGSTLPPASDATLAWTSPSGRTTVVQAFPYEGTLAFRFTPVEVGQYEYALRVEGVSEPVKKARGRLVAEASKAHGFVHASKTQPHQLVYDDGTPVHLIGENRFNVYDPTWNYQNMDSDAYIRMMAEHGENALRIFMFSDCEDESRADRAQPGCIEPRVGEFDDRVAHNYDRMFSAAEQHGVLVVLTLFAIGFTPGDVWKGWEDNPYSRVKGGPAETPSDFFRDEASRKAALHRLEYVLARYGASPSLLAIDLINEPEWDGAIGEETWIPWARELGRAWRERDPYGHLVTAGPVGLHWNVDGDERSWYGAPENDIVQWHLYGQEVYEVHNLAREITRKVRETWDYQKPVLLGEFAYGGEAKDLYDHTHVGVWSTTFSGAGVLAHSAPPFTEDSDEFMTPERGRHLRVLRDFLERIEPVGDPIDGRRLTVSLAGAQAWALALPEGMALWLLAPENDYGKTVSDARLSISDVRCEELEVEAWDDTTGAQLSAADARVSPQEGTAPGLCRAEVSLPPFTRHVAAVLRGRSQNGLNDAARTP